MLCVRRSATPVAVRWSQRSIRAITSACHNGATAPAFSSTGCTPVVYHEPDRRRYSLPEYKRATFGLLFTSVVFCEAKNVDDTGDSKQNASEFQSPKRIGVQQYQANKRIEDRISVDTIELGPRQTALLVTVLDGHGGWQIAEFVQKNLSKIVEEETKKVRVALEATAEEMQEIFVASYQRMEDMIYQSVKAAFDVGYNRLVMVGACALSMLVDSHSIVVANSGDCKAVMSRAGKAVALSYQFTCNNEAEQRRLRKEHPNERDVVVNHRGVPVDPSTSTDSGGYQGEGSFFSKLNPFGMMRKEVDDSNGQQAKLKSQGGESCYVKKLLQPTRSFGDFYLKYKEMAVDPETKMCIVDPPHSFPYITATPQVQVFLRHPKDEFVIAASDGIWDYLTDQEAVDIVKQHIEKGSQEAANALVEAALSRASKETGMPINVMRSLPPGKRRDYHDDITVCVVALK